MSMAAWPSMTPASPRSAWTRASSTMRGVSVRRNANARNPIMIGPPADRENPRTSAQRISHVIAKEMRSAWTRPIAKPPSDSGGYLGNRPAATLDLRQGRLPLFVERQDLQLDREIDLAERPARRR